ncbi:hypothetical protein PILCRDRAFT_15010 [Piloderma croceum F 1598]|uniref:DNA 3'-5' helicase n=1 Tax=Piloderma croceum (strain F 1598) TaxID=765440 RepID=A0A0C3AIR4_PILCF|nr:hypothetical protein PILCRDRAFT_15010 [Piloderma croceum F 1598]
MTVKSYNILTKAQEDAARKKGYDSQRTRDELKQLFCERFGTDPFEWQLDMTEAILLGLDSVVIAGTGAGKTMPFMMPLLLDKAKKVIIVSPLKVLQADQAVRFEQMQIPTVAVNGDTWDSDLRKGLTEDLFQGILTSPEMCLQHDEFRKILIEEKFSKNICAMYAFLEKLRAFFPPDIPFLPTLATLPPLALREVRSKLAIDPNTSFYLSLSNDRPNIAWSVQQINGSDDYEALRPLLAANITKTIVFTNTVNSSQIGCKRIHLFFAKQLCKYMDCLHSHRTVKAKRRVMRRFRQGKVKILIATEAAGMGADILDIEQVIQFGVPSSLSVWIQRAGRAGCSPDINARAILLVEKSMFQWRKKHKKRGQESDDSEESGSDIGEEESEEEEEDEIGADSSNMEYGKKVEPELQLWIECANCWRDVADEYFNNPPVRKDNSSTDGTDGHPHTPTPSGLNSEHTTPSKSPNAHGKRQMHASKGGPATRRGEHLQDARGALEHWWFKTQRDHYSPSSVTAVTLLPDPTLMTLASNARICTTEDIKAVVKPPWIMARRHGNEVLALLMVIDDAEKLTREETKRSKAKKRRKVTGRKKNSREATKPKQLPRPALAGLSVFNVTPLPRAAMRQASELHLQGVLPALNLLPSMTPSQPPIHLHWTPPSTPHSINPSFKLITITIQYINATSDFSWRTSTLSTPTSLLSWPFT